MYYIPQSTVSASITSHMEDNTEHATNIEIPANRQVLSVSELTGQVRDVLEDNFPLIWVEGEISNLAQPSSGHVYFSLKDANAQVRCAMFRMQKRKISFNLENGMQVLARARVSIYEARGDFQLIIDTMEEAGDGALRREFERLKKQLADEGLFEEDSKLPIPLMPQCIGVITSPTGAAIRDILSVLKRRFPLAPVKIYPVPVQGKEAANDIADMIAYANKQNLCDVLILSRGGGSLEDLWAFNEEPVARAIHAAQIPLVSGIGHETDFTIADFVADHRAATPSAAAELVSPNAEQWLQAFEKLDARLVYLVRNLIEQQKQTLTHLGKRLQHPGRRLQMQSQRVDELEQRLANAMAGKTRQVHARLDTLMAKLSKNTPSNKLQLFTTRQQDLSYRLALAMKQQIKSKQQILSNVVRALDAISPLSTLSRGYSIVRKWPQQKLIQSFRDISCGDKIEARLKHGRLICNVEETLEQ